MIALTNNLRKTVFSLDKAKVRKETGLFLAEGEKCVEDTIGNFSLEVLIACEGWIESHPELAARYRSYLCHATAKDLGRMTHFATPPEVIAVYHMPSSRLETSYPEGLYLALDTIQNPGNLGTVIRTADWFGITTVFCSPDCADIFSPKAVQATMGALSRVKVVYCDLRDAVNALPLPVYGTFLDGKNIYASELSSSGLIIMGNEGKGISDEIAALVSHRLYIPSYPPGRPTSESLNVATATAITLSEFRRRL